MQVSVLIRKSVFRLQDIYELDISQIAAGKIGRKISIENQTLWDRDQTCRVATLRRKH